MGVDSTPILTMENLLQDLHEHLTLAREALSLAEREGQHLRRPDEPDLRSVYQAKKTLLPKLDQSLVKLRRHRLAWQRLSPGERARQPEVAALLRQSQDQIMKILVLDRENEQTLLRRGLIPARDVGQLTPSPRPHFVADRYRRQSAV